MKRARILQKLAFFIEEDQRKVYGKNYTCNYKENKIIIHRSLPFVFLDGPDIDHKSYDSGSDIEMEKCHSLDPCMLETATAMLKNNIAQAVPTPTVVHGTSATVPGANTPITNDANIIFAPSKKKFEITFMPFLSCICKKFTTELGYCQAGNGRL